jgi:hypothetical protein
VGKFALVVVVFAAIVYTGFWLLERHRIQREDPTWVPRRVRRRRALAPDDDEEFLRGLNARRRPPDQTPDDPR